MADLAIDKELVEDDVFGEGFDGHLLIPAQFIDADLLCIFIAGCVELGFGMTDENEVVEGCGECAKARDE